MNFHIPELTWGWWAASAAFVLVPTIIVMWVRLFRKFVQSESESERDEYTRQAEAHRQEPKMVDLTCFDQDGMGYDFWKDVYVKIFGMSTRIGSYAYVCQILSDLYGRDNDRPRQLTAQGMEAIVDECVCNNEDDKEENLSIRLSRYLIPHEPEKRSEVEREWVDKTNFQEACYYCQLDKSINEAVKANFVMPDLGD